MSSGTRPVIHGTSFSRPVNPVHRFECSSLLLLYLVGLVRAISEREIMRCINFFDRFRHAVGW